MRQEAKHEYETRVNCSRSRLADRHINGRDDGAGDNQPRTTDAQEGIG
jgi:hypothetical protein